MLNCMFWWIICLLQCSMTYANGNGFVFRNQCCYLIPQALYSLLPDRSFPVPEHPQCLFARALMPVSPWAIFTCISFPTFAHTPVCPECRRQQSAFCSITPSLLILEHNHMPKDWWKNRSGILTHGGQKVWPQILLITRELSDTNEIRHVAFAWTAATVRMTCTLQSRWGVTFSQNEPRGDLILSRVCASGSYLGASEARARWRESTRPLGWTWIHPSRNVVCGI